jgi:hypothetical protein
MGVLVHLRAAQSRPGAVIMIVLLVVGFPLLYLNEARLHDNALIGLKAFLIPSMPGIALILLREEILSKRRPILLWCIISTAGLLVCLWLVFLHTVSIRYTVNEESMRMIIGNVAEAAFYDDKIASPSSAENNESDNRAAINYQIAAVSRLSKQRFLLPSILVVNLIGIVSSLISIKKGMGRGWGQIA